jgi:hypothetical protein
MDHLLFNVKLKASSQEKEDGQGTAKGQEDKAACQQRFGRGRRD